MTATPSRRRVAAALASLPFAAAAKAQGLLGAAPLNGQTREGRKCDMLYIVHRVDAVGRSADRDRLRAAHLAYLKENEAKIVAAGPYMDPRDGSDRGSMFIIRCRDIDEASRFANDDPFTKAGMFSDLQVWRWTKRIGPLDIKENDPVDDR